MGRPRSAQPAVRHAPGHFTLSTDARVNYARPSVDVLFESAADAYGPAAIGVILTGANEDGAAGLARIKEAGGVAIVQDPRTAERRAMPDAANAATSADVVLPLDEIAPFLSGLCLGPATARAVRERRRKTGTKSRGRPPLARQASSRK
jgi:two-component system chemotaxis response regulator CheB